MNAGYGGNRRVAAFLVAFATWDLTYYLWLYVLAGWRETPFYSDRERAALAWCESLTMLPQTGAPDDVYEELTRRFSPEEIVALTLEVVAINGWNRLAVGFRRPVGDYVSGRGAVDSAPSTSRR
jgi:hypothetical protein